MASRLLQVCGIDGCVYATKYAHVLGKHRYDKHDVAGASKSDLTKAAKTRVKSTPVKVGRPASSKTKTKIKAKGKTNNGVIPIEVVAYTVGRIESDLHHFAAQLDLAPKLFAQRCAEYLLKATLR